MAGSEGSIWMEVLELLKFRSWHAEQRYWKKSELYSDIHRSTKTVHHSCFLSVRRTFSININACFQWVVFPVTLRYATEKWPLPGTIIFCTFFVCGDWANKAASHAWAGGRVVEFQCIFSRLNFSIFHSILLQRDDCYQRKPKHFVYLCSFLSKRWRRRKK